MKRIVLHIGTHKTGTTSIQRQIFKNRKRLLNDGVFYPEIEFGTKPVLKKHMGFHSALRTGGAESKQSLNALISAFHNSGADTMILSEEGLALLPSRAPGSLNILTPLRAEFELETICFLRRPDYFVESMWNQHCREGATKRHIRSYYKSPFARSYLQYNAFLSEWSKVSRLNVLGFEESREKGIVPTFCEAAGIPMLPPGRALNVSPSMTCVAVLAGLARTSSQSYDWKLIDLVLGPDARKTALGQSLRAKILRDFQKQRRVLEDSYGVTFPDDLPDEPVKMLERPPEVLVSRFKEERFYTQNKEYRGLKAKLSHGLSVVKVLAFKGRKN